MKKRLLLASSGSFLTEKGLSLFEKPLNKMKMAYITTASKKVDDLSYIEAEKKRFEELNFDYEEIDIDNKSEDELRKILEDKKAVYVTGGNTYYLLKCARSSGFDKIIKELVEKGVIYIGSSAGSYLVCPTIEMAAWKDKKRGFRRDRCSVEDFTGINLVPFLVFAHYTSEYKEIIEEKKQKLDYDIKVLTDERAVLVNGEEVKIIE